MKAVFVLVALTGLLCSFVPQGQRDRLDDLIDQLKEGKTLDLEEKGVVLDFTRELAVQAYADGVANLYLWQIKASIVDPEDHGGWPWRSYLVDDPIDRKKLRKTLTSRFEKQPDRILAYALIPLALFAGDEAQVSHLQVYLMDEEFYLYSVARGRIDEWWRPQIAKMLAEEAAGDVEDGK